MFLEKLLIKNFRNHVEREFSFGPKINCIVGNNGIGKTNVLEAICLLSTGRSFRTNELTDLIQHGASYFYIEAAFVKDGISQSLKIGYDGKTKKIEHNASTLTTFSSLLGILPSVFYAPKDISLITGAPVERRRFLNLYLGQIDPLYVYHLMRYAKALKQRNCLLKSKSTCESIECFEKEMAISSFYLMSKRKEALSELLSEAVTFSSKLTSKNEPFSVKYEPSMHLTSDFSQENLSFQLKKIRGKEMILGTSLIGPHRDDFSLFLENQLVKAFCSEGQKRTFLSALRLGEWSLLKKRHESYPLMCIDDMGIHLDPSRHALLENEISSLGQVFVTSPEKSCLSSSTTFFSL